MVDALTAICENKKEVKGLDFALELLGYILENPDQRGFQALRNFLKVEAVLVWKPENTTACFHDYQMPLKDMGITDTFYLENKD